QSQAPFGAKLSHGNLHALPLCCFAWGLHREGKRAMSMDIAVESDGEEIVLYFNIDADGVDAQTFGNALISFDGLYRAINGVLNPGVEVQIEFIRSDQGSIRAILRS